MLFSTGPYWPVVARYGLYGSLDGLSRCGNIITRASAATSIVQALDDATLEAIAAGTLDMLAMCRQVADEIHQAA